MAKIQELYDRASGETIYPVSTTQAVVCPSGLDLETRLTTEKQAIESQLSNVYGAEPLTPENFPDITVLTRQELKMDLFIDMWERACKFNGVDHYFGRYNRETGYFELNGITDITYDEALMIWERSEHGLLSNVVGNVNHYKFGGGGSNRYNAYSDCRTYFPIISGSNYAAPNLNYAFHGNTVVEVLNFVGGYGNDLSNMPSLYSTFSGCKSLRRILCDIGLPMVNDSTFYNCTSLEYISITTSVNNSTFNFQWSPNLSRESVSLFVSQAVFEDADTEHVKTLTFVAHPDVFAKLTDENNEEWHSLVSLAAEKNITFETV